MNSIVQFLHDEEGATALEYGLLAALIAGGLVAVVNQFSTGINSVFTAATTGAKDKADAALK